MEEDSITIMVVRQSGKIRTVKIAPKKLYIFFSGLSGLVLAFFVLLYGYIEAYQRNSGLSTTVRSILDAQETAPVFKPFSGGDADSVMPDAAEPSGTGEANPPDEQPVPPSVQESIVENGAESGGASSAIAIDELRINAIQNPPGLKFSFRLSNIERESTLSGFLAVVGSPGNGRASSFGVYPEAPIDNSGAPTDFRRGEWFSIRRFKFVQGTLPVNDSTKEYSKIEIFIYSENGKLILRKIMDVPSKP